MGHRLTKIYTRTGDDGSTGLGNGERVPKDHQRVEAYGAVDELNSVLGLLLAESPGATLQPELTRIQHTLFDLGGELSIPGRTVLKDNQVVLLEDLLDRLNAPLPPLKEFILPGGSRIAALCHLARTVCRRAERRVYTLSRRDTINPVSLRYLNRLSDLLFVMARLANHEQSVPDVLWQPMPKGP